MSFKKDPIKRGMYAWNKVYAGSFLLYVSTLKDCYKFLFLPGPSEFFLTKEDFIRCMENNTIEFVEELPKDIYQETLSIYELTCPNKTINMDTYENEKSSSQ